MRRNLFLVTKCPGGTGARWAEHRFYNARDAGSLALYGIAVLKVKGDLGKVAIKLSKFQNTPLAAWRGMILA